MRPIDADALITKLDEMIGAAILSDTKIHYALIRELVARQPTVAEQPTIEPEVRHGWWIPYGRDSAYNSYIRCSNCNHEVVLYEDSIKENPKYCEECGYRMNGCADNG